MAQDICSFWKTEKALLTATNVHACLEEGIITQSLADGDFLAHLSSSLGEKIFSKFLKDCDPRSIGDALQKSVNFWLTDKSSLKRQLEVLSVGAAALLAFVQCNWTGPNPNSSDVPWFRQFQTDITAEDLQSNIISNLVLDGESVCSVVSHPELLLFARAALFSELPDLESALWWQLRCLIIHQQVLDEWSPQLHKLLISLVEQLALSERILADPQLHVMMQLEIAQAHLLYHEVKPSAASLQGALKAADMSMDLVGALGKRTRFQVKETAQLILRVETGLDSDSDVTPDSDLPKDLTLTDEVRLNKIAYSNASDGEFAALTPLQQACVLGMFIQTKKSQPKDKLADEELMAYINCLLSKPLVWSIQLAVLLFRSKIESNHSRTIERSMTQLQALLDAVSATSPNVWQRLRLIFCSHLCPRWKLEQELAGLLVSLGCINSALDIYLHLQAWEEVIACYNHLKLRHKAAEVIRQELQKKETVKLWCLLGDATDDIECYQKAWSLSGERSGRAQRHWGLYYFNHKQYGDALPHLQLSLSLNSLQVTLWFQLGYAALQQEDWATAATAYRRYCCLEPENFEAWNNLAKAYIKLGQKNRAWKALQEALKWNYENWRVWDNFLVVSVDCAAMDEVIRAYHRLLDLKERHVDIEVLEILGKAVMENLPDSEGQPCGRLLSKVIELMGRLTAQVTTDWKVWRLYSRLSACVSPSTPETEHRSIQQMQKAHRAAVVNAAWVHDSELCHQVLNLSADLASASLNYMQKNPSNNQASSVLSSARLSVKSVLTKVKQERWDLLTNDIQAEMLEEYQRLQVLLEQVQQAAR